MINTVNFQMQKKNVLIVCFNNYFNYGYYYYRYISKAAH